MILACQECATTYALDAAAVPDEGRTVKCARCGHMWLAMPSDLFEAPQATSQPATDPDDDAFEMDDAGGAEESADDSDAMAMADDMMAAMENPDEAEEDEPADEPADQAADLAADLDADLDADGDLPAADAVGDGQGDELADEAADKDSSRAESSWLDIGDDQGSDRASSSDPDEEGAERAETSRFKMPGKAALIGIAAAVVVAVGLGAGLFTFRENVVRLLPGTARIYAFVGYPVNLRGLEFANLEYLRRNENGLTVLQIRGEVRNITDEPRPLPQIRFGLRNGRAQEIYNWTATIEADTLGPREARPFVTRLASPPQAAQLIEVRFSNSRRTGSRL